MKTRLIVYGVDEYQGALISRRAAERGLAHIGAGRNIARVAAHANGFTARASRPVEPRVFGIADVARMATQLDDVAVIVNCATPLAETAGPLIAAALATGTHYVDLGCTRGHLASLMARDGDAVAAGIVLVPGAAFGFAAADAMAARLATLLPAARALTIASKRGRLTRGEAHDLIAALRQPGETVKNGQFVAADPASRRIEIDFGQGPEIAHLAPWRGEAVALRRRGPYSTIESHEVLPPALTRAMQGGALARFMFRRGWRLKTLERRLTRGREGPSEAELSRERAVVCAEARTPDGKVRRARLETPAAALYTADVALVVAQKLVEGKIAPGLRLPSEVGGSALFETIAGVIWREIADATETLAPDLAALAAAR